MVIQYSTVHYCHHKLGHNNNNANNDKQPGFRSWMAPIVHTCDYWLPLGQLSIHLVAASAFFLGNQPIIFLSPVFRGRDLAEPSSSDPSLTLSVYLSCEHQRWLCDCNWSNQNQPQDFLETARSEGFSLSPGMLSSSVFCSHHSTTGGTVCLRIGANTWESWAIQRNKVLLNITWVPWIKPCLNQAVTPEFLII